MLAHEVGHVVHRHVLKRLAMHGAWLACGLFLCDRLLCWLAEQQGHPFQYAESPFHIIPLCLLVLATWSAVSLPALTAINRRFERQADRYALDRAKSAADYRSAMNKLAHFNGLSMNAHLLEVLFFCDHPAPAQRIAMAGCEG
jgi:STE24 endopeptidase